VNHRYYRTKVTFEVLTHDRARLFLMKDLKKLNECGPVRLMKVKHKRVKVREYIDAISLVVSREDRGIKT